jgi:hypothetical protein
LRRFAPTPHPSLADARPTFSRKGRRESPPQLFYHLVSGCYQAAGLNAMSRLQIGSEITVNCELLRLRSIEAQDRKSDEESAPRDRQKNTWNNTARVHTSASGRERKVWFRARECSFGHSLLKPQFGRRRSILPVQPRPYCARSGRSIVTLVRCVSAGLAFHSEERHRSVGSGNWPAG